MQRPLQITIRYMARAHALTKRVREEVGKLSGNYPNIVAAVWSRAAAPAQETGSVVQCLNALGVLGQELIVSHDHDEDVYTALRDAFASVTRRLGYLARRHRGATRTETV